jgi:hypothetical protein
MHSSVSRLQLGMSDGDSTSTVSSALVSTSTSSASESESSAERAGRASDADPQADKIRRNETVRVTRMLLTGLAANCLSIARPASIGSLLASSFFFIEAAPPRSAIDAEESTVEPVLQGSLASQ